MEIVKSWLVRAVDRRDSSMMPVCGFASDSSTRRVSRVIIDVLHLIKSVARVIFLFL